MISVLNLYTIIRLGLHAALIMFYYDDVQRECVSVYNSRVLSVVSELCTIACVKQLSVCLCSKLRVKLRARDKIHNK